MTAFQKFWASLVAANPALRDEDARCTLKVGEFKRLLRKSFRAGETAGMDAERVLARLRSPGSPFGGIFDR